MPTNRLCPCLSGTEGLGAGLRAVSLPGIPAPAGRAWQAQLHEKLYCFSHPEPIAFVGSFNPSGDNPKSAPTSSKKSVIRTEGTTCW